jgi:hypothetical protein
MVGHAEDPTGGGKSCKKWGVTSKWANGPDWSVDFSGAEPFAVATIGTSTRVFARICGD